MKQEFTISWNSIFRILVALGGVYLFLVLNKIILMIIVSSMLAAAFHPVVLVLQKKMPVALASVLVILLLLLPIFILAFTFIPSLINQFPDILSTLDRAINQSNLLPPAVKNVDLSQYGQNIGAYLFQSTSLITGFLTTFTTIIFLTLYFLIDSKRLLKLIFSIAPANIEEKLLGASEELIKINGNYIRGNLTISAICGIVIFIGLFALGVPYAAPLALLAAVLDLLPLIGAFAGAVPAAIIAFSISPTIGIAVLILFVLYQQFENNIVAPNVYNQALDISPALSFIAVIVGATLFGMFGAFIALPVAASIPTLVEYIRKK